MSDTSDNPAPPPAAAPAPIEPALEWAIIAEAGGIRSWVEAELVRKGLSDEGVDTSTLSAKARKRYKLRREEERKVRRQLYAQAWQLYKGANLVHLGVGVFYHDTADVDRYDIAEPEARRTANEIPELADARALAKALDLTMSRLRWLCFHREVDSGTHYHRWLVPKRDGGMRLISAPKPELKAAQHWVARQISEHLPVHGAAHGFLTGRSTVTNASAHAGADVVVKFDIKDFYPSVTTPRVKGLFRKAGYGEQVATVLAMLTTESPREEIELRGRKYYVATGARSLPQGAPTSPSITNALSLRLDCRLAGLAKSFGLRYTRYADDLTFSFHEGSHAPVGRLIGAVTRIVADQGFTINEAKTRVMRSGRRQKITGLVVNSGPEGAPLARVPRRLVRQLRTAIYKREQGQSTRETMDQLRGWAAYVYMTNAERGRAFLDRLSRLPNDES